MANRLFLALLCGFTLSGWTGRAAGTVTGYSHVADPDYRHSNRFFGNLPGTLRTPHIAWAEPHALGSLKLLLVLPIGAARESLELRERIPADVSLITMQKHDGWATASREAAYDPVPSAEVLDDTARRLLSPAFRYDAIVIGKVRWPAIPESIRRLVLDKVRGGTALVFVSPWDVDAALLKEMNLGTPANPLAAELQGTVPLSVLPLDMDTEKVYPKHFLPRRIGPLQVRTGKLGELKK